MRTSAPFESALISQMLERVQEKTQRSLSTDADDKTEKAKPILKLIGQKSIIRIAGPCALQSQDQAMAILDDIAQIADMMRAPHHKPRTRPVDCDGNVLYTGMSPEAAFPIYDAIQATGMPVTTEIIEPRHIDMLKNAISMAWVGSRTMCGDLIEKIGAAAADAGLPIMVKNPMMDQPEIFIGMIESAIKGSGGSVPVIACIRGLCPTNPDEKAKWRNVPMPGYVSDLRESFPNLTIIVDPSHMAHKKDPNPEETIKQILIEAMSRGANGHMVEVTHPDYPSITDPGIPTHAYLDMIADNLTL